MKDVFSPLRDAVFGVYEISTMNTGIARILKEGRRFRHHEGKRSLTYIKYLKESG